MTSPPIRGRITLHRPTPPTALPTVTPNPAYVCKPNLYKLFEGYLATGAIDGKSKVRARFRRPCSTLSSYIRFLSSPTLRTCDPHSLITLNGTTADESDQNDLGTEDEFVSQIEVLNTIAYRYVLPVLIFLAVLTNLMNILMLWKVRNQQKLQKRQAQATTYCYLMWLAITDLMASLSLIPALLHLDRSELTYEWAFYYAHVEISVMNALTSASVYIVVGLSVDRYIAVCHPRRYHSVNAPRLAIFRIALSLIVPVFIYIPHFFYQKVVCANTGMAWTYQENEDLVGSPIWHVWEVIVELCHRMAPATILAILNLCIIITFKRVTARRKAITNNKDVAMNNENSTEAKSEEGGRSQQEKRLVNLLVAIVTTFLVTHLPAAALALKDTDGTNLGSFHHEVFRAVANCLEVLGFSLNFVLYFFFVNGMRQVLKDAAVLVKSKVCGLMVHTNVTRVCSTSSGSDTKDGSLKNTECVEL